MAKSTSSTLQSPLVSSIPSLHAFDNRTTTWQSYRDRICFYFKANRINVDDDKKALFLWSVGDTTYNLLESLVSPKSLTSEDTSYSDLIGLLDAHYDDTKNIMTSTYDFYSCYQRDGQPFAEWKAELCEKLRHCGFTTSTLKNKPQDRALRDMYVIGINDSKIRQALLKEQDPDLETAERIIQVAERLQQDVRHFNSPTNPYNQTVAKIQHQQSNRQTRSSNNSSKNNNDNQCDSCGSNEHLRSTCKYRNYACNFCKRTGHLERACRQKSEQENSINYITNSVKVNHIDSDQSKYSTTVSLRVNDHDLNFQIDTGTTDTIININDWYKLGSPRLRSSQLKINCYSGARLQVKGKCYVKVVYKNQYFNLPVMVVHGNKPSLLGLDWIKILQLDLNRIVYRSSYGTHSVHHISTQLDQTNKPTKLRKQLQSYRSIPNTSTDYSSANKLQQRPIQKTVNKCKFYQSAVPRTRAKFHVNQLVWTLNHQLNPRSKWQAALIKRNLGSMVYEVQLNNGYLIKRHENQLRHRYSSNNQLFEMNSLLDDLLNRKLQYNTIRPRQLSSSRQPHRIRKPPDRLTPS